MNESGTPAYFDDLQLKTTTAVSLQENNYDPFGLNLVGIESSSGVDDSRYQYNGKEKQEDFGLNWMDYGARMYDAQLGRWHAVDPKAHLMTGLSPYSYCFNNPISFIDPDGQIPYPITIRAFAPSSYFGLGFHGDDRGYSTSPTAKARVHQRINFDTDKTSMITQAWSSPTSHRLIPGSMKEIPSVNFTSELKITKSGDAKTFDFGSHVAGSNPMVPGAPPIDIFSKFSITENKKAGTLDISGTLKGDNFPSTEAFVTDPSGQNLFIGIGFYKGSPFSSLYGENKRDISSFEFSISTDKKGDFTGVKMGDKSFSIEDWNKMFQQANPYKNEEK